MNNPNDVPIDPQEQFSWLLQYKLEKGFSWAQLAKVTGISAGTLSTVTHREYKGNADTQARRVFQFRQQIEIQQTRARSVLADPVFIETPSARRVQFLLEVAQMGRITVAAMGPGTGKTMTARHYKASIGANVWMCTMLQSTKTVSSMINQVMKAMGLQSRHGWTQVKSAQVVEHTEGRAGLLIIDEAGNLDWSALEELRGWHDASGLGIALLGNEELMLRIRGNQNRHAYARLNSRIANCHIQDMPTEADVVTYLDAMDLDDGAMRKEMISRALSPGHGGLRELRQILESANMLAIADETVIQAAHLREAMNNRATSQMRRAS